MPHSGFSESGTSIGSPFGGLPQNLANKYAQSDLLPLLKGLGLGSGPGFQRFESRLQQSQGPLGNLIQGIQGFEPSVMPQARQIGQEVSAQGSGAFEQLQQQIQQSLAALPQYQQGGQQGLQYAEQFAQNAFSPVSQQPLFQEASRNLLDSIRPGMAARGLDTGGAGQKAETDATRNLAFQFGMNQQAAQEAAIPQLGQAAQTGAGLAQAGISPAQQGLSAVGDLGNYLQQQYGIPMQAIGNLMSLLTAGGAQTQGLISATSPIALPHSKGTNLF